MDAGGHVDAAICTFFAAGLWGVRPANGEPVVAQVQAGSGHVVSARPTEAC